MSAAHPAGPHYRVAAAHPAAHLWGVTLTVAASALAGEITAWTPGALAARP